MKPKTLIKNIPHSKSRCGLNILHLMDMRDEERDSFRKAVMKKMIAEELDHLV